MAESATHKQLKKLALFYLKDKVVDIVANEVVFKNIRCVADAVGLNIKRKEVRVIECKATRDDYFRDIKLFGGKTSYFSHAHYCYIFCPEQTLLPTEVPVGYGLLWLMEDGTVKVSKKPTKNANALRTKFETTMKRAVRRLSNALLYA